MIKSGDRIFNFEKRMQPDNGKQGDMTKHPESPMKSQEKQAGQCNEDVEIKRHIEQLPKTERLNEIVHAMESYVGKFNAALRTGILAAAMAMSPNTTHAQEGSEHFRSEVGVQSDTQQSQEKQKRIYTREDHKEEMEINKREAIAALSKFFDNPSQVFDACGGVVDFQRNSKDEDTPLFVNIGQVHGFVDYTDDETYVSQPLVSNCVISMIEQNNTGKVLPVGLEYSTETTDRGDGLEELILHELNQVHNSKDDKEAFSDKLVRKRFNEKLNEFSYKINPKNLYPLSTPLLTIIGHFEPEEKADVMRDVDTLLNTAGGPNVVFKQITPRLMELLYKIEKEHNAHFEITDTYSSTPYPDEDVAEYLLSSFFALSSQNQDFLKMVSVVREFHNDAIIKRDNFAIESSLKLAEKLDAPLAICIFGSSHDFRDDAAKRNVNLLRIETAPSNVHSGMVTYEITEGYFLDSPYRSYGIPISPEIVHSWNLGGGGREATKDYLLYMRRQYYHFLFRNAHSVQSVLQFSQDEWFSIIRDSIQDRKHLWAHGVYGDIEKFKRYLSTEHLTSLKGIISRCEEHAKSGRKR